VLADADLSVLWSHPAELATMPSPSGALTGDGHAEESTGFADDLKIPLKRASTRIIRTFEEIEVEKKVLQEEWYEELECGMWVLCNRFRPMLT